MRGCRNKTWRQAGYAAAVAGGLAVCPTPAQADPCEAALPRQAGQTFAGTVRYVGDGDGLCVGMSADPTTWIEVRLADFDAPELRSAEGPRAKAILHRIAFGLVAECTAKRGRGGRVTSFDRVIAICLANGRSLGDQMRSAGAPEGGD